MNWACKLKTWVSKIKEVKREMKWQCTPIILAPQGLMQEDGEFGACLKYIWQSAGQPKRHSKTLLQLWGTLPSEKQSPQKNIVNLISNKRLVSTMLTLNNHVTTDTQMYRKHTKIPMTSVVTRETKQTTRRLLHPHQRNY